MSTIPRQLLAGTKTCANPDCERVLTDQDNGCLRCRACHAYTKRNGTERPEDLVIAHNRRKHERRYTTVRRRKR